MRMQDRYQQATDGLVISKSDNTVYVADGQTSWICERNEWNSAREALTRREPLTREDEESGCNAYTDLCNAIGGIIVTTAGTDQGSEAERRALVRIADEDGTLPVRHYFRERWLRA